MKEETTRRRSSSRVAWESLENWACLEFQEWIQDLMVAEVTEHPGRGKSERRKPVIRVSPDPVVACKWFRVAEILDERREWSEIPDAADLEKLRRKTSKELSKLKKSLSAEKLRECERLVSEFMAVKQHPS